jgi:uncharacterized membrane protein YkvA (DUF1232 family)
MALLFRLRELGSLWRQIPLTWRLMFDGRTPLRAKLLFIGVLLLIVSPINWIPNAIPIVGELDDLALFVLAMHLFLHNVPDWLRREG